MTCLDAQVMSWGVKGHASPVMADQALDVAVVSGDQAKVFLFMGVIFHYVEIK